MKRETYIIENKFLRKELKIERKRIVGFSYYNKLSESNLTAEDGSEVFELSFDGGFFGKKINASELKIDKTTELIENFSKKHVITFKPLKIKDSVINVSLI